MEREELLARHRKENKTLRAKIQVLKKGIPKGDKKRKKEVAAEIASLEQELEARHKEELAIFPVLSDDGMGSEDAEENERSCNGMTSAMVETDRTGHGSAGSGGVEEAAETNVNSGAKDDAMKMSRAQKRKAKKAQLEREKAKRIAEAEAAEATLPSVRQEEKDKLAAILTPLGLAIRDITPDGHCLYAAVSDQLSVKVKIKVSVLELRRSCSEYIRCNSSEFLPYFTHSETGTQEEFDQYCHDIAETAAWGGQPEIRALSHIYEVPINIYQASVPVVCVGEEYLGKEPLNLSYHLHEYGLGEHYNSVVPMELVTGIDDCT